VEVLKQDQYQPLPVAQQVAVIFAAVNGFFDDVPVPAVRRCEGELLSFLNARRADVLKSLGEKKTIDDAVKAALTDALTEFKKGFKA
jgi:F-type H+-transporting ATPase subunit alpha